MQSIPSHLRTDPEWAAVAAIFDYFPHDWRVWDHVDIADRSIYFERMFGEGGFSSSEALLLCAAASLWKGCGYEISLGRVANVLDETALRVLLRALAAYRRVPITWASETL